MRGLILVASGFSLSLAAGWLVAPNWSYRTAPQPLQFSHAVHTGGDNKMACQDCHGIQDDGKFAGLPVLSGCATCHTAPMGKTKDEAVFVKDYVTPGREPKWMVASRQPDNAWFPHAAHVKRGKLACETCHGAVGKSQTLPLVQVNRISGYSRTVMTRMRMDDCVACHKKHSLSHSCLDCHR